MPNINLIQNTTGEEPKPKEKKTPPPVYTNPPPVAKVPEPNPVKKLSPLGTFFDKPKPAQSPAAPTKEPANLGKDSSKPVSKTAEIIQTKPVERRRSWLSGVINFVKPQSKVADETTGFPTEAVSRHTTQPTPKADPVRGTKILEEKVLTKKTGRAGAKPSDENRASGSWLGVNLMPDDMIDNLEPKKKLLTYFIVLIISAAIVGGGYGGLVWYENRIYDQANQTTQEIDQVNSKILALHAEQQKAVLFKSQTDAIGSILNQHIYWTRFFAQLEKYTMPSVEYKSFSGSFTPGTNPTFSISATTDSFDSVSQQILAFREAITNGDFISVALIDSGNKTTNKDSSVESVLFTVQITTLEKVFYRLASDGAPTNNQ